ncbi:MAG: ATP-binding cassette domain-containing protein, partial [Hyphococcus sp.]
ARRKRNVRRVGELKALRKELRDRQRGPGSVQFAGSDVARAGKRVIVTDNATKRYGARTIVSGFSVEIARGDKIGVVGPNGAGKTTMLNLLTGALAPDDGAVRLGTNLDIVTLDQRRDSLKPEMRLADAITDARGDWVEIAGAKKHVATYLQDFLFTPEQWRAPVSSLSGGERGRLALAAALAKPSNLLVLDEPTNDLDLDTLELLEELLAGYAGTLLLVSHDRSFIDNIVTSVITTDPDQPGVWRRYAGGYDDMIAQRGAEPGGAAPVSEARAAPEAGSNQQRGKPAKQKTGRARLSYKEQYALETLPGEIDALQDNIRMLRQDLEDPSLYERDPEAFDRKAAALKEAEARLHEREEQWLALAEKREAREAG